MDEEEWIACDDASAMLYLLEPGNQHPSARKAKLFAVAVCRRIWNLLPDDRSRNAVSVAERFADGKATRQDLAASQAAVRKTRHETARMTARTAAASAARHAAGIQRYYSTIMTASDACLAAVRATVGELADGTATGAAQRIEGMAQAILLRDILGPLPFRTLRIDPAWRTPLVLSLAQAAYEERVASDPSRPGWLVIDRDRLNILADALEDVGADDPEILEHLRGEGEHVRGCWCLDLLLCRE